MLALIRDGQHNPPLALAEVPEPVPARDQALVEVHASSLNRGELALLSARSDGWRPGQDLAGVVVHPAASGDGPRAGSRVVGLVENAGWSELAAVPVARLAEIDDTVSFTDAAALPMAGLTALRVLRLAGPLLGRKVLILGARGVGHLTVQLATLAGARVAGHDVNPDRAGGLIQTGADDVFIGEEPEQAAFDVVIDGVGGASLERAIRAIAPDGTIVLFGAGDQQSAKLTLLDFIGHEGARILTYFSYASGDEASIGRDLAILADLLADGRLRPKIDAIEDWHLADQALTRLRSRQVTGKAVLTINANGDRVATG